MTEHWMRRAVAAGQTVVGEAGDLQVASFQQDDCAGQQVVVDTDRQQVVEPAQGTDVVQLVLGQVDVAQMQVRSQ